MEINDKQWIAQYDESFDEVCRNLKDISLTLQEWLPDPSIGPEERLERLARVIPHSILCSENRLNARTKLNRLRRRLIELVPHIEGDKERLQYLYDCVNERIPGNQSLIEKLEQIKDFRGTDTGLSPRSWR